LAESPSFGQHIIKYEPTSNGATDYRNLAKEVAAMEVPEEPEPAPPAAKPPVQVTVNPEVDAAKLRAPTSEEGAAVK
jgi:hypothetical protein